MSMRWYSSTSETAARMASETEIEREPPRRVDVPASTSRESLLRRIRAARWSRRNRLCSRCGSSSSRSRCSMRVSCWSISEVLRRDSVSNMWLTWTRSRAWSPASERACWWRSSTARASWPISSEVCTGIGSNGGGSSPSRMPANRLGELVPGDVEGAPAHGAERHEQGAQQRQDDGQGEDERADDEADVEERAGPVSSRSRSAASTPGPRAGGRPSTHRRRCCACSRHRRRRAGRGRGEPPWRFTDRA